MGITPSSPIVLFVTFVSLRVPLITKVVLSSLVGFLE